MSPNRISQTSFYVSTKGSDGWSGTLADPNADGTDGPFATLVQARDAIRTLKQDGLNTDVTVWIREGTYALESPFILEPEDSGTEAHRITYAAYPAEIPVLSGGILVSGWQRVTEEIESIGEKARGNIWAADAPADLPFNQLYLNGERLPRSAIPNGEDWNNWPKAAPGAQREELILPRGALKRWANLPDVEINFLSVLWANSFSPIEIVDEAAGIVRVLRERITRPESMPMLKEIAFRIENAMEGIDQPGEWCLDTSAGKIYCWPPNGVDMNAVEIMIPKLSETVGLIGQEEKNRFVTFVTLKDLTLADGQIGLRLRGVSDITIEGCTVQNVNVHGISVEEYAQRVLVHQNEVRRCGRSGIVFRGHGPGTHQVNRDNRVAENHVHHCGCVFWHSSGIGLSMVGHSTVSKNRIHDSPYAGVVVGGGPKVRDFNRLRGQPGKGYRWDEIGDAPFTIDGLKPFIPGHNTVEYNLIHDTMQQIDDGAGIYTHAGHHALIRNNLIYRSGRDFSFGIYLDDEETDSIVEHNVVYLCPDVSKAGRGAAFMLHDNARNTVRNNIFAFSSRLFRFPNCYGGHTVTHNIFLFQGECAAETDPSPVRGPGDGRRQEDWDAGPSVMDHNLYWHVDGEEAARDFMNAWRERGWDVRGLAADPLFENAAEFNFRLRTESPAFALGIQPIHLRGVPNGSEHNT